MALFQALRARRALGGLALAAAAASGCSDDPTGPSPGVPETVRVSYCEGLEPTWVAFQDGDGPWTRVMPTAAGGNVTFLYAFQADRGGIATLTPGAGGYTALLVLYGAPAELATAGDTKGTYCGLMSKTILGSVVGLDTNEFALVSGHLSATFVTPASDGSFALTALGAGPHDVIATRHTESGDRTLATAVVLRRDVDLPDGATAPAFDFTSPESFPPSTARLTLGNAEPNGARVAVRLITTTTEAFISPFASPTLDLARPYTALPETRLRPGDLQELSASTADGVASRRIDVYFRSPVDRSLTLPAALARPWLDTIASAPTLSLRARFERQADYDRAASIVYQQGASVLVGVTMTAAYAAVTEGGYELIVPDLSSAADFDPAWTLHAGARITWTAGRIGGTVGLGADPHLGDGSTRRAAFDADTLPGA